MGLILSSSELLLRSSNLPLTEHNLISKVSGVLQNRQIPLKDLQASQKLQKKIGVLQNRQIPLNTFNGLAGKSKVTKKN